MERMIEIDGKPVRMVANGATPLIYRTQFQRDVFGDIQNAVVGGKLTDISTLERLAYTLVRQGGEVECSIEEWLTSLDDPMALVMAAGDILQLWAGNRTTMSDAKKKRAR